MNERPSTRAPSNLRTRAIAKLANRTGSNLRAGGQPARNFNIADLA